jgi:hypothetical protein
MSAEQVSRREVLGAAVAAPLACHPELGSGSSSPPHERATSRTLKQVQRDEQDWHAALAGFRQAEGLVAGIEGATAGCSFEEEEALIGAHDAACEAMAGALARLLAAPAPGLPALLVKLELLFAHAVEPHAADEAGVASVLGDARRLLALTLPSP